VRHLRRLRRAAILTGLAVLGCSGPAPTGRAPDSTGAPGPGAPPMARAEARAAALEARRATLVAREGKLAHGDAVASYRAFISAGGVEFIEERLDQGDHGWSLNRYYFGGGPLFFYRETGERMEDHPDGASGRHEVALAVAFDAAGDPIASRQEIGGESVPLESRAAPAIVRRAEGLRRLAEAAPPDTAVPPDPAALPDTAVPPDPAVPPDTAVPPDPRQP